MTENEVKAIVEKYREMSNNTSFYEDDQCFFFERIADFIQDDINQYVDNDEYESEQDSGETGKIELSIQDSVFDREDYINMGLLDDPYNEL